MVDGVQLVAAIIAQEATVTAVPHFDGGNTFVDRIIVTVDTADHGRDRFAGRARADALAIGTAEAPGWLDLGRGAHHRARRPADAHPPWAAGG